MNDDSTDMPKPSPRFGECPSNMKLNNREKDSLSLASLGSNVEDEYNVG